MKRSDLMKRVLNVLKQIVSTMTQFPAPLLRKIVITSLIGAGCTIFGLAYWIAAKDRILLFLSLALLIACLCRAWSFYRLAAQQKYKVMEGVCVGVTPHLLGKHKEVRLLEDSGEERNLRLPKNCGLKTGRRYRLYFDERNQQLTGSGFLDVALAANGFLGYDEAAAPGTPADVE